MPQKVLHLNTTFKANKQNITTAEFFGKKHIVIEGVGSMIADTVMNGILYTREAIEDLAANTKDFVHAPSSHPVDSKGNFILAGSPEAIHQNYVGAFAFNYRMKGDRLIHDLAIDPEKANMSEDGKEIMVRINNQTDIDKSTGLLIFSMDEVQGIGNDGMPYFYKANKMELDHDAILLRERGAATTLQGVGMFANKDNTKTDVDSFTVNATIANTELDVVDIEFDKEAAFERIKEFTNSGDVPSSNFRRFFLDFDRDNVDSYDAYNFLFADVVDGKPVAVKQALNECMAEIESIELDNKKIIVNTIKTYLLRMEKKENNGGMFSNAWKHIKNFLFGNEIGHRDIHEQIYQLLNKNSGDSYSYPVDIFEDYFIFEKKGGNLYKKWYNIVNDIVVLDDKEQEVTRKIIYQPKESSEMNELMLNALKAAGVSVDGLETDEQIFAAYNEQFSAKEKSEVKTEEAKVEVEANKEQDIQALVKQAVADAFSALNSDKEKSEAEDLAAKVVALNKGIDAETASEMSVNSLKKFLSANGHVAFNAKSDYTINNNAQFSDELPE